jgi:hypothetical protein
MLNRHAEDRVQKDLTLWVLGCCVFVVVVPDGSALELCLAVLADKLCLWSFVSVIGCSPQ